MTGSETFIIVAFRCSEKSTPFSFASAICSAKKDRRAETLMRRGVEHLAGFELQAVLEDVRLPVGVDELDLHGGRLRRA